jgi:hypothetical protein
MKLQMLDPCVDAVATLTKRAGRRKASDVNGEEFHNK